MTSSAVFEGFRRCARRTPSAIAVHYQNQSWSYDSLLERVLAAGARLQALGIGHGDRVAFLARNSDSYLIGWLATQAVGAVHVPINYMLGPAEIRYILEHAEPKILYATDEFRASADKASLDLGWKIQVLPIDELKNGGTPLELPPPALGMASQLAQIAYTSGTESAPKGAMLTDLGLVHEYMSCIHVGEYNSADVIVNALPMYHCAQMHCFITPQLFLGSENIILDRADPSEIIQTIQKYKATSFFAPPTVWIGILNHQTFEPEKLRSLNKGYYGASIMPTEVLRSMRTLLPWLRFWNYYGQTEIGPLATALRPEEHDARPSSAGRPVLFVDTRVVDDDMNDVKTGEVGELVHRSPQLLEGYYRDPQKTAEAFRGGWFHSGDLGVMDAEGYIEIVDRKKDMIKSGGENVSSREVEEVIYKHPAVAEVAVIGLPDEKWIEAVCAVVVRRQDKDVAPNEIIDFTASSLAPYKRPKQVHFVETLPKNPSGKILKKDLRALFGAGK